VFTFGVGDDVNTALLDRLAEKTRALSTYVRPEEKIEDKVSTLYSKMSNPVLTNLRIETTGDVKLSEVYPVALPDLFHGGQVEVMCRFSGKGPAALVLTGKVGKDEKKFVYDLTFPEKTDDSKEFVEPLWARRKVGSLLDQIRVKGENAELKDEVVLLAKKYGITTPYTSWLIVPDGVTPSPVPAGGKPGGPVPLALGRPGIGGGGLPPGAAPAPVLDFARKGEGKDGDREKERARLADAELQEAGKGKGGDGKKAMETLARRDALLKARGLFGKGDKDGATTGKTGVDIAVETGDLRDSRRVTRSAIREAGGRRLLEVGGVWIDEGFTAKTDAVVVKAMSDAYFAILAAHPEMKRVFQTGNHLIWITPSGKALVIDASHGKEKASEIDVKALFTATK